MGTERPWARGRWQAEAGDPGRSEDGDLAGKPSGEPGGSRGLSSRGSRWGGCGGVARQGGGKSTGSGACLRGGGGPWRRREESGGRGGREAKPLYWDPRGSRMRVRPEGGL